MVWSRPSTRILILAAAAAEASPATRAKTTKRTRERRNTNPPSARGSGLRRAAGLLTRGSLSRRLPGLYDQWHFGAGATPLTAAGPSRIRTGVPEPLAGSVQEPSTVIGSLSD